jgi:hypothetical protein
MNRINCCAHNLRFIFKTICEVFEEKMISNELLMV